MGSFEKIKDGKILDKKLFIFSNNNSKNSNKEIISNSIFDQIVSDVPIGIFFSGGLDSSLIASETKLSLLHMDYGYKDTQYAKKIAKELGNSFLSVHQPGKWSVMFYQTWIVVEDFLNIQYHSILFVKYFQALCLL